MKTSVAQRKEEFQRLTVLHNNGRLGTWKEVKRYFKLAEEFDSYSKKVKPLIINDFGS